MKRTIIRNTILNITTIIIIILSLFSLTNKSNARIYSTNNFVSEILKSYLQENIYIEQLTNFTINHNADKFRIDSTNFSHFSNQDIIFAISQKYDFDKDYNSPQNFIPQVVELINFIDTTLLLDQSGAKITLSNPTNTKKIRNNKKGNGKNDVVRDPNKYNKEFFLDIDNMIYLNDTLSKWIVQISRDSTQINRYLNIANLKNRRLSILKKEIQKILRDNKVYEKEYLLINNSLLYFFDSNNLLYKNYNIEFQNNIQDANENLRNFTALQNLKVFIKNNKIKNIVFSDYDNSNNLKVALQNLCLEGKVNFIDINFNTMVTSTNRFEYTDFMKLLTKQF